VIGIDPWYFWDEMSSDELVAIYKAKNEADRVSWEQTRLICFYNMAAMNGTRVFKKPSDLFKLNWDNKEKPKIKRLTKDEVITRRNSMHYGK
jgi:hypothetical protein